MKKCLFMSSIFVLTVALLMKLSGAPAMAAEKGKYGGILKFNHSKPAGIIGNPLKIRGWNHEFIDNTLQTLIRPHKDKMGAVEPLLAESWELAPDKSYYIFKLRKGVKFHDGTDFNAQAVKWNLDKWVKSKRPRLDKVTSIEVIDDYTVKCNLSGWDAVTLLDFAKDTFMISPTAWEINGPEWVDFNPVGTGPFMMTYFKRNTLLKFAKFKDYWRKGFPYLDEIHITQIADPMTAQASIKKGDIDVWLGVDHISASQLRKDGQLEVITNPAIHNVLQFNSTDPSSPWSKKKMREALEYAIDKEAICQSVGRGLLKPVYEIVHGIPPKAGTTPRKYNPERAKQLIKEAGYGDGLKVKLTYGVDPVAKDIVVALQANLSAVGIQIIPNPLVGAAFHQAMFKPVPGNSLVLGNQRGSRNELLVSVDETLAPGSVFFKGVKRPKGFNELLGKALQNEDFEERMGILYKMEKIAYEDAFFVPLWELTFCAVQHPYVKNAIWFWASQPYPNLEQTWLDK